MNKKILSAKEPMAIQNFIK